ncbi:lysine exporter LysO family protein [Xenorhabdus bovienii]|uniref:lysine exporter LysO family protein n=1 Tax=Xenorhabdus bovienii TaxID=40576 RepID=UPI003DA44CFE
MKDSLSVIVIIVSLLIIGFFLGKGIKTNIRDYLVSLISKIVIILLLCMGIELGEVFNNTNAGVSIVKKSIILASLISLSTFFLFIKYREKNKSGYNKPNFKKPIISCAVAMLSFILGVLFYSYTKISLHSISLSSNYVLYLLIVLVGMDLVNFKLSGIKFDAIKIPFITILGTVIAAAIFSKIYNYSLVESMLVSSGFGWFSLSGPMVNTLATPELGALAFMTDFFREIISIIFLYFMGRSQPQGAIGISGAAALDSALPFIKENCKPDNIKYAIVSGFILTLLAPLLISLLASLL